MPITLRNATNTGVVDLTVAIGGAAPSSGDSLYVTEAAVSYTTNINFLAVDLAKLVVGGQFKKDIGVSGDPLIVGVSSGASAIAIFSGGFGTCYIKAGATVGLIDRLEVRPDGSGAGRVIVVGDTTTDSYVFAGSLTFTGSAVATNVYAKGGHTNLMEGGSAATIVDARGTAVVDLGRDVGTLTVAENATVTVSSTTCTPTTLTIDGGDCNYAGGNIGTVTGKGGHWNLADLKADIVVTNATFHEGVRITPPPSGISVTFTNPPTYIGQKCQRYPGT